MVCIKKDIERGIAYMWYLIGSVVATFVILGVLWVISIQFVRTGRLSALDWSLKSLGLPQGSVRALIALLFLFLLIFSAVTGTKLPDLPPWLVGILGTIIGFYFGAAMVPKVPKQPSKPEEGTTPKPQ